ncbi:MAG: imidazoleglycerol-phosphate dehydratase HisB [Chloroflexi bacterium]|nr:imidazoleglycerol-phosphate dehydratase HisB [Chloroflexota bacterium]
MTERRGAFQRRTRETDTAATWDLDGRGEAEVSTGIGMLDHLISQIARHGRFDLALQAQGDLHVDAHHTVEDAAIVLARAFDGALGERRGITRMGDATVPLDEALALVAVDLGGRGYAVLDLPFGGPVLGQLPTELIEHFLETFAREGRMTLHARLLAGRNDHHRAEAVFKALARALDQATTRDERLAGEVPSTKGVIERVSHQEEAPPVPPAPKPVDPLNRPIRYRGR